MMSQPWSQLAKLTCVALGNRRRASRSTCLENDSAIPVPLDRGEAPCRYLPENNLSVSIDVAH